MDKRWAAVRGMDGFYEVSDSGEIRGLDRIIHRKNGKPKAVKGIIKKTHPDKDGYIKAHLRKNGNVLNIGVHIAVAFAFIPNPDGKPAVNHKDGNKANNHVSNLEWCTNLENLIHARSELGRKGRYGIPVLQMDEKYNIIKEWETLTSVKKAGFSYRNVTSVLWGQREFAHGNIWRYKTERYKRFPCNKGSFIPFSFGVVN